MTVTPGNTKYVFVTGGVVSSLGKGIAAASLGRLLVERGLTVTLQKFDPYINVDPGTMSPFQHGEVYVTDDGAETDLDLGLLQLEQLRALYYGLTIGVARLDRPAEPGIDTPTDLIRAESLWLASAMGDR